MKKLFGLSLFILSAFGPELVFPLMSPAAELPLLIEQTSVGVAAERLPIGEFSPDAFFDRYFSLEDFVAAWNAGDSGRCCDLALGAAEGKDVLMRDRRGLPLGLVWSCAVRTATVNRDVDSMRRLAAAAGRFEMPTEKAGLEAVARHSATSRNDATAPQVNLQETTPDDFVSMKEHLDAARLAGIRFDERSLLNLRQTLNSLQAGVGRRQLATVVDRHLAELKTVDSASPHRSAAAVVARLSAVSRGWTTERNWLQGGWKAGGIYVWFDGAHSCRVPSGTGAINARYWPDGDSSRFVIRRDGAASDVRIRRLNANIFEWTDDTATRRFERVTRTK